MQKYTLSEIEVPVTLGVEVSDRVTFYRRDSRNESHVALEGTVTEIDEDSFDERWLTITYDDSRFGVLNYTLSESAYQAYWDAQNPVITRVNRVVEMAVA